MRQRPSRMRLLVLVALLNGIHGLIPLIDGGKSMPKLYDGWFNEQIAKQAGTAVGKAIASGKVSMVNK